MGAHVTHVSCIEALVVASICVNFVSTNILENANRLVIYNRIDSNNCESISIYPLDEID